MKRSESYREKHRKPGCKNSNYSGYTDDMIEKSFLECCAYLKYIPSKTTWVKWAKENQRPYLTSFKSFRFDGNGFKYLCIIAEKTLGFKHDLYYTRRNKNLK